MKLPANDVSSIEYQMGYAADEFAQVLNRSFNGGQSNYQCLAISKHHWQIQQQDSDLKITIRIKQKTPRKLGLFTLPVLQVNFETEKSDPMTQREFFNRFFKYFHKGGG